MAASGLNVATKAGEGDAYVYHWEQFDAAMKSVYERDLFNQKNILNEYNRLNIGLTDASKGLRPADMPLFKQNYDKFKQASLMMQSRQIRNNPQQLSFWKNQQDQAFLDNMSLAKQSEDATKFKTDIWGQIAKDPEKFYEFGHLRKINEIYDASPVAQLNAMGFNTATPWMHPADAYPQEQFDDHILGKPKIVPGKPEPVKDDKTGMNRGWWNTTQEIYQKKPSQIAADVAIGMQQVWSVAKQWKQKYSNDMQQPEVVDGVIDKAQEILDADPSNNGYKLDKSYGGYAAASYILRSQPTTVGARSFTTDPAWKEYEDDLDREDQQKFLRGMEGTRYQHQKGLASFKQTLKNMGLTFSGEEMYGAATKPYESYVPSDSPKQTPVYGFQLLDKRMAEIMAKAPKNLDYAIVTKYTIANTEERRRLIDKIFGAPTALSTDKVLRELYDPNRKEDTEANIQKFIGYLNSKGMDINESDVNNTAVPVIIDRIKGMRYPINPNTHNYDQFVQQISQIIEQTKPKGVLVDDEDFNQATIESLHNYLNR